MTTKPKPKPRPKDRRIEQITLRASEAERTRLAQLAHAMGIESAEVLRRGANLVAKSEGRTYVFR